MYIQKASHFSSSVLSDPNTTIKVH